MVVKRIQPMRIQSIKASIKVSTDEISKGMSTIIDSSVTSSLESCAVFLVMIIIKMSIGT